MCNIVQNVLNEIPVVLNFTLLISQCVIGETDDIILIVSFLN